VEASFADAVILETVILSILNHDCAIAAAASRMVTAAGGRPLIEMGGRRTHEQAAVAAARAAYIAGFAATSNLEAGRRHNIPTVGTSMHAFTLAHLDEQAAFRSQLQCQGVGTTLLVDTYDTATGIANAITVAREFGAPGPGAVRLDSGDMAVEVPAARVLLDSLGAVDTRIVVTGDLDEFGIAALAHLPVDTYGVGTSLVTGSGHPAAGLVYKLVAIETDDGSFRDVAKSSPGKVSVGGRKWAYRTLGDDGYATDEQVVLRRSGEGFHADGRALLTLVIDRGERVTAEDLPAARRRHAAAVSELRPLHQAIDPGPAAFTGRPR
jgi:nicotinate phosphoribosyltransferase